MLVAVICCVALEALKRTDCDVWQLECEASNVRATIQSDHLLQGHMLPVYFAIDQLHCPTRSAEIKSMSQQAAATTRVYCGLVLDTHAPASCPDEVIYWL